MGLTIIMLAVQRAVHILSLNTELLFYKEDLTWPTCGRNQRTVVKRVADLVIVKRLSESLKGVSRNRANGSSSPVGDIIHFENEIFTAHPEVLSSL